MTNKLSKAEVLRNFRRAWRETCADDPELTNDKPAKREAFSAYIDRLHRDGSITDRLADSIDLD